MITYQSRRRFRILHALKLYYNRVYGHVANLPDDAPENIKEDLMQELVETNQEIEEIKTRMSEKIENFKSIVL